MVKIKQTSSPRTRLPRKHQIPPPLPLGKILSRPFLRPTLQVAPHIPDVTMDGATPFPPFSPPQLRRPGPYPPLDPSPMEFGS